MFKPINKKLIIDYQPNKQLVVKLGDFEKQEKYIKYFPFYKLSKRNYLLKIFVVLTSFIFFFVIIRWTFVILFVYLLLLYIGLKVNTFFIDINSGYHFEVTSESIKIYDLGDCEEHTLTENEVLKITFVRGEQCEDIMWTEFETFIIPTLGDELSQEQQIFIADAILELLDLELKSKEEEMENCNFTTLTYQSRNV